MFPLTALPRPRRTLLEVLAGVQVASLSDRDYHLTQLRAWLPVLPATQPLRRLYQLPYLAEENLQPFVAGLEARKMASLGLLGKLSYGEDELGLVVSSELVGAYLLCSGQPGCGTVGLLPARMPGFVLPVPNSLFLGRLLVAATRIIW